MRKSRMQDIEIRESTGSDVAGIEALYPQAFPDEDLLDLVRALLEAGPTALSLVAVIGPKLVGHAVLTRCAVAGADVEAALLGPLAVAPAAQKQGVGSAIVRAGLQRLESDGVSVVLVLGDPAYYKRFGFAQERLVAPPCRLPDEWRGAWQSLKLNSTVGRISGTLSVPAPWRDPALWAP